ncbi:MAG: tetratricopeptide repeat protein [Flammeovirgaceae bacterium]|jgi:tetratricopeptide (TPR) repeat protein|nr:tetratricopeptide repeat protein [Flammeovirgaceae bacterium]|tara:strand:+ start:661 stop:1884 length:1224 start_codon:yes stop_codon:yes gene_type:complete
MKRITLITLLLLFNFSFSQKKELRKAQKLYDAGDVSGASQLLEENQSLFENADQKVKPGYDFLTGKIAQNNKEFQRAYDLFTSLKDVASIKEEVMEQLNLLSADIVNSAIDDNGGGDFKSSTEKLYLAYLIDPELNKDYLYFAASSAVNAEMYDVALEYYDQLKEMAYTGVVTKYYVTEVESGVETEVTESEYDLYKKSKSYENVREEDTPSKFPEIVKNIALIHAQRGDNEKAMIAVQEARLSNPTDLNLILTEANIYIQLDEKAKFQSLMNEAIAQDPDNANLYYNLAVVTADLGEKEAARAYYEKAIEKDPNYENAYLNLVALILEGEQTIVEQMNSLGTSAADNAKYDALKLDREEIYKECVPILKSLIEIGENEDAIKTLMNIYGTLGDNEGYKEMKTLLEK